MLEPAEYLQADEELTVAEGYSAIAALCIACLIIGILIGAISEAVIGRIV